jgi:hypothetical protein
MMLQVKSAVRRNRESLHDKSALTAPSGRGSLCATGVLASRDQRKRWMHGFFAVLTLFTPLAHAERWKVQYFYDELRKSLYIEDLAFPTPSRGIAVGTIVQENPSRGGNQSIALLTSDGGVHWTEQPLKDRPRSIFFLNDSVGWMVGDDAIWMTEESGHTWKKVGDQKKPDKKIGTTPPGGLITRVWFLDPQHGFAAGLQKSVFETHDSGKTWEEVEEASKPSGNPAYAVYSEIYFENKKHGIAVGGSLPPRPDDPRLPSWMEPERAVKRRQVPTLTFMIETYDAGEHWHITTAPLMGNLVSVKMAGGVGLAVFGFEESFDWPSEVYKLDLTGNKSERVFREKNRRVVDCAMFPTRAYLAAVEPPGKLNSLPIPGKVKMLTTLDFETWTEMEVDYKAVARSLVLAGPDPDHQWAATDTGMILHLIQ